MKKRDNKTGKYQKSLKKIKCKNCGKLFNPRNYRIKNCSKKCGYLYRSKTYKPTKKTLKKLSEIRSGIKRTKKWRDNISKSLKGEKNGSWRGGITKIRNRKRDLRKQRRWREKIFARDNYTCQECGQIGGKLEAHHIIPFWANKETRYLIENGITLCKSCHKKETIKDRKKNWTNQFSK